MRRIWLVLACLFITLPAHALETVRFQLDWMPTGERAALYLGIQKGVFAAEGLNVVIVPGRGSSDALVKLGSGVSDIGTGGLSTLLSAKAGSDLPVTALMPIFTKQPDAIGTVSRNNISSLKDLVGKRIASGPFSSSTPMLPVFLSANGIDPASIKLQRVDPVALSGMLAEGRVDAVVLWTLEAPRYQAVVEAAGLKLVVLPWSDFGFDGYGSTLFASDAFLKAHPETVRKFVRAFMKTYRMAAEDPASAAAAQHDIVPEIDFDISRAEWQATLPLVFNEVTTKDGFGTFDKARLAQSWLWVARSQGLDPKLLDPETVVDRSFIPAD